MSAEFSPLSCNRILLCAILSAACLQAAGQDAGWVIAAEKFDDKNIPGQYARYAEAIPLLLVSELSRTASRRILPDEKRSRAMRSLSSARLKLIRERAALALERDRILLTADQELVKKRKLREAENRIRDKEAEIAASEEEARMPAEAASGTAGAVVPVSLWKSGTGLFVRPADTGLAEALSAAGISAILTGTAEDMPACVCVSRARAQKATRFSTIL